MIFLCVVAVLLAATSAQLQGKLKRVKVPDYTLCTSGYFWSADFGDDDCTYHQCVDGHIKRNDFVAVQRRCMAPLVWDRTQNLCDFAINIPGSDPSCHGEPTAAPTDEPCSVSDPASQCCYVNILYEKLDTSTYRHFPDRPDTSVRYTEILTCPENREFDLTECICLENSEPVQQECPGCLYWSFSSWIDANHDVPIYPGSSELVQGGPGGADDHIGLFIRGPTPAKLPIFIHNWYGQEFTLAFLIDSSDINGVITNGDVNDGGNIQATFELQCRRGTVSVTLWDIANDYTVMATGEKGALGQVIIKLSPEGLQVNKDGAVAPIPNGFVFKGTDSPLVFDINANLAHLAICDFAWTPNEMDVYGDNVGEIPTRSS